MAVRFLQSDLARENRENGLPSASEVSHGSNVPKEKIESPQKSEEARTREGEEGPPSGEESICTSADSGGRWRDADL